MPRDLIFGQLSEELLTEFTKDRAGALMLRGDTFKLLPLMKDASVDLIVASPPYCMGKEYEKSTSLQDFVTNHEKLIPELVRIVKPGGSICWQVGFHIKRDTVYPLDYEVFRIFSMQKELNLRNRVIWTYGHGLHCTHRFSGRHETVLWFTKGRDYEFNIDAVRVKQKYPGKLAYKGKNKGLPSGNPLGKNPGDVWELPNVKGNHIEKTIHPCQFPVSLAQRLVLALTKPNQIVFDPFSGVASTGVASLISGRRFIGTELNRRYYACAKLRLTDANNGLARYRPHDRPIYVPSATEKVARDPFVIQFPNGKEIAS